VGVDAETPKERARKRENLLAEIAAELVSFIRAERSYREHIPYVGASGVHAVFTGSVDLVMRFWDAPRPGCPRLPPPGRLSVVLARPFSSQAALLLQSTFNSREEFRDAIKGSGLWPFLFGGPWVRVAGGHRCCDGGFACELLRPDKAMAIQGPSFFALRPSRPPMPAGDSDEDLVSEFVLGYEAALAQHRAIQCGQVPSHLLTVEAPKVKVT